MQTKQNSLTVELLKLTEKPYEEYNAVLSTIMTQFPLDVQVETFQRVLTEELPVQTARRAYRLAIRIAMGETIDRERLRVTKKFNPPKKITKKETK